MATRNDGRVVYFGDSAQDWYDVTGILEVQEIVGRGINEVLVEESAERLSTGIVDVGKRLRPNYRDGKIVLYVARGEHSHWEAVRRT
jgi:hypothetical protein